MIADKEKFDVVVVGAGPAGSVAARFAAQNGASVLILERDREPGIPVRCAEGVSHNGIVQFIDIDPKWVATEIKGAILHSPNGEKIKMSHVGKGYVLERRLFDAALCEQAVKAGAKLLTKADALDLIWENGKICGVKYKRLNQIKTVMCDLVIGADGIESRVGRWANIDTSLALNDVDTCVQYTLTNIETVENYCEFYFGNEVAPGGYLWIFPKSKNSANVGIGIAADKAKDKGPKAYLDEFVAKRFPKSSSIYDVYGGVPTSSYLKEMAKDNIMLVGDAARQVNPITGGGIVQAMVGAFICGKTAGDAVKANDFSTKFLKRYVKEWDNVLGGTQRFMYQIKDKFMRMDDNKFNNIVAGCSKIADEKLSLTKLFSEALKEDPIMVAKVAAAFVVSKIKII